LSELEQKAALIRFFFNKDYRKFDDDFFRAWGQLEFALLYEKKLDKVVTKRG